MMKLKKVKQKIVLQHQDIVDGKENLKLLVEGLAAGGLVLTPQEQSPPHIFIQSEHTHYKPYLGLFQEKLR